MTRTMNPSTWAKRLAAVFGASVMAFALVAPTAQAADYPTPDLSKKPRMEHIMNQDFGTPGVKVKVRVQDYDHENIESTVYAEARVELTVSGFNGPVTVWARNLGSAYKEGSARPWQKVVARPKNGKIVVVLPVAEKFHCAKLTFRVNDNSGRWTKAFTAVTVRDTPEPHDSNGGTIHW